ncbi:MAG: RNA methyltransferase [Propionivibrio sp.]
MKLLASRHNPHFKALKKLVSSGRERHQTGLAVLDGMHLLAAYAQHGGAPDEIVVSEHGQAQREIAVYLENISPGTRITALTNELFGDVATVETPSGIMAIIKQPRCASAPDDLADSVVLDGIQDAGNVGSIMRSAAAAGFRQVLLSGDCAQAWSPKTLRAAMGAHFQLAIHEDCDLIAFLRDYRGQAIRTELDTTTSLYALDLGQPLAWVFGNEGQGIRAGVAATIARSVRIPMPGGSESLNVAAAAAVCLFETVRQRL